MMIDANALIFGLIPNRTLEKTFIGSVVDPGPETKLAMTMSSRERVKARSHAASKAGVMIGMVITKKTFSGEAPRSIPASSRDRSISFNREERITVTNAVLNVTWAIQMVSIPLPPGQPKDFSIATKSRSSESPVMTSGITNGAVIIPAKDILPRNRPKRTRANDANIPITRDMQAVRNAIFKLIHAASSNC